MSGYRWLAVTVMALWLFLGGAGSFAFARQEGTPAEGPHHGMMMGGGGHQSMMGHGDVAERAPISFLLESKEALNLTAEQVQKLEAVRSDFRKAGIRRSADLQIAEVELEELQRKEPLDLAKVEAQVKRIETLRAEQRLSRIKAIETGKALLTPEQRQKLDTLGQSRAGRHTTGMTGCPMMMGG
ncbi:MAG: Spy/CpxP family protein refolding chaperone [Candidatus Methylomirabilales bacterium]